MKVTVLYFAAAKERAETGRESVVFAPRDLRVREVLTRAVELHPALAPLIPYLQVAVNHEVASLDELVPDGAEVALLPPVSGGSGSRFRIGEGPLQLEDVVREVESPSRGAVVTFTGVVRNDKQGRRVVGLEYEAYVPMAERILAQLGVEAAKHWPGIEISVHHRIGKLVPGELSVVIAVASPHRAESFDACRYVIEELKRRLPVWKRETYEDGEVWV